MPRGLSYRITLGEPSEENICCVTQDEGGGCNTGVKAAREGAMVAWPNIQKFGGLFTSQCQRLCSIQQMTAYTVRAVRSWSWDTSRYCTTIKGCSWGRFLMLMIRLETTKTRNTDEAAIVHTNCELQELLKCHFRLFFFAVSMLKGLLKEQSGLFCKLPWKICKHMGRRHKTARKFNIKKQTQLSKIEPFRFLQYC